MLLLVGIGVALTLRSAAGQDVTWTVQFGTTGDDEASELTVDGSGHIYVVGSTFGSLPGQTNPRGADAYLRKYGPDANEVWTRQFGTEDFDVARAIVVDVTGNLYLVGSTADTLPGQTSFGNIDAYLKKYDANGVEACTRQFGSGSFDFGQDVAIDGAGNLYVAGSTWGAHPGETDMGVQDAFVRKYDSDGLEVWTRQFGTIGFDEAASLGVDDAGNVYVTGWTDEALPGQTNAGLGEDAYLRKYDSNGFEIWTRQFGTEGSDLAVGVVVSGDSGVFVAGYTDGALPGQASSGSFDGYLRSYDADGLELWTLQFGSPRSAGDVGAGIDGAGDVYVAGETGGAFPGYAYLGGRNDAFLLKISGVQMSTSPDNTLPKAVPTATPQPIAAKATQTETATATPSPTSTTGIRATPTPTATVIAIPIPTRTPTPETATGGCTAIAGGGDTVNAGWLPLGLTFPGVAMLGLRRRSASRR